MYCQTNVEGFSCFITPLAIKIQNPHQTTWSHETIQSQQDEYRGHNKVLKILKSYLCYFDNFAFALQLQPLFGHKTYLWIDIDEPRHNSANGRIIHLTSASRITLTASNRISFQFVCSSCIEEISFRTYGENQIGFWRAAIKDL